MIVLQPFVNVKNIRKTPAEGNIAGQRVKERDMNEVRQEDTEVRDTGSWRLVDDTNGKAPFHFEIFSGLLTRTYSISLMLNCLILSLLRSRRKRSKAVK